jgi:hypothetical protein
MATHTFPAYPKPEIPLGYGTLNGRKTFKAEYYIDMYAQLILNLIPMNYVNNVCSWKDTERNTTIITVIADESCGVWEVLHIAMDYADREYEYV